MCPPSNVPTHSSLCAEHSNSVRLGPSTIILSQSTVAQGEQKTNEDTSQTVSHQQNQEYMLLEVSFWIPSVAQLQSATPFALEDAPRQRSERARTPRA